MFGFDNLVQKYGHDVADEISRFISAREAMRVAQHHGSWTAKNDRAFLELQQKVAKLRARSEN